MRVRTMVSFAWMDLVAVASVVAALLPLAIRGRPLGRRDRVGASPDAGAAAVAEPVELESDELPSAGQG